MTVDEVLQKWLKRVLFGLLPLPAAALLWVCWSLVVYRDLPVTMLEERYGAPELRQANVDGVSLRYRVEGSGPALLLIHSLYFDMGMWDGWTPKLADRFKVIRFDMTGHGLTGPEPNGDYSMARDLALILGLLDHLGVERLAVAGSSLGGALAFHLAAQQPQRFAKLALLNASGIPRPGGRGGDAIPGWVDSLAYLIPTTAFRYFLEWMVLDDGLVTADQAKRFHQMLRRQGNRTALLDRLRGFRPRDPADALAAVQMPVLLLWGADNPQLPVSHLDRFEALLTNAPCVRRIAYPGVGHVIPLEAPAKGIADLEAFLLEENAC